MRIFGRLLCQNVQVKSLESYKAEATIYFHWPFCKNLCTFCNFNKYVKSAEKYATNFEELLTQSMLKETRNLVGMSEVTNVKSIYFGGGTPSLAPTDTISQLIQCVKSLAKSKTGSKMEVSIECNPSSTSMSDKLRQYHNGGVNRISIGLQSLQDPILKLLGRDHSAKDGLQLLMDAQKIFGCSAVSVDLLFGKPRDTVKSWIDELCQTLDYHPFHISLYELTPERGTLYFKQLKSGEVKSPEKEEVEDLYEATVQLLESLGYYRYEVSNFAKIGSSTESLHNSSYWDGTQYIGVGPGAHSRFYRRNQNTREARVQCLEPKQWQMIVERDGHATQISRSQNIPEILSELLATSLRTIKGVQQTRWNLFEPNISLSNMFKEAQLLQPAFQGGFLQFDDDGNLSTTKKGIGVVDAMLPNMLAILNRHYD